MIYKCTSALSPFYGRGEQSLRVEQPPSGQSHDEDASTPSGALGVGSKRRDLRERLLHHDCQTDQGLKLGASHVYVGTRRGSRLSTRSRPVPIRRPEDRYRGLASARCGYFGLESLMPFPFAAIAYSYVDAEFVFRHLFWCVLLRDSHCRRWHSIAVISVGVW